MHRPPRLVRVAGIGGVGEIEVLQPVVEPVAQLDRDVVVAVEHWRGPQRRLGDLIGRALLRGRGGCKQGGKESGGGNQGSHDDDPTPALGPRQAEPPPPPFA